MTQYDPNAAGSPQQPPDQPPSGPPQAPIQPAGYGYPQQAYAQPASGYPAQAGTNGFAIASIICAFLCVPLGLVFGIIARNQIKTSHEGGNGLALAGIIISAIFLVLIVLYIIAIFTFFHAVVSSPGYFNIYNNNIP